MIIMDSGDFLNVLHNHIIYQKAPVLQIKNTLFVKHRHLPTL